MASIFEPSVIWNAGLKRFQDAASRQIVGFRDAAERVRRIEVTPGNWRIQDASGRFVGVPQFGTSSEFAWVSPNKRQIYFNKTTDPHVVGEFSKLTVNKGTNYEYLSEGEVVGEATASTGYGIRYSLEELENEMEQLHAYQEQLALDLGIDMSEIDEVRKSYFEREIYNPIS